MRPESFGGEVAADEAEAERLLSRLREWLAPRVSAQDRFAIELLCREAICNAVQHGSRSDPSKRVRLDLRLEEALVSCSVEDEGGGEGLSPASILKRLYCMSKDEGGRGLAIISHYADRISIEEGGRIISFERRLTGRTAG